MEYVFKSTSKTTWSAEMISNGVKQPKAKIFLHLG